MEKYLSVTEYANINHKDVGNVRRLLLANRLEGTKVGKQWLIKEGTPYPKDSRIKNEQYLNIRKIRAFYSKKELVGFLKEMSARLMFLYKEDLKAIVIYGSYARGTETIDSDIDIALMITSSIKERRNLMIEIVSEYELLIGKTISAIEIEENKYSKWEDIMPFYKNIKKEGIVLWKTISIT